jgi:hypothetical protein
MAIDEQARHRLHRKLEEVLGPEEAGILMDHLPPRGFGDLATKGDLELLRTAMKADIDGFRATMGQLEERLTGQMERIFRHVIQWTSSTVLVGIGVSIAVSQLV